MTDDEKLRAEISAEVFDGKPAGTPPDTDKPLEKAEEAQPAETPAPSQEPVDEWAGIAPALRAKFEQMATGLSEFETVKARLQQAERRVGALTNELHEAKKKPEPTPETTPAPVAESWRKFNDEYQEISTPIEERIAAVRAEVLQKVPSIDEKTLVETISKTIKADLKAELEYELAVQRVDDAHPGWQDTKETPEFKDWHAKAPADVPRVATTARDAIKLMDAYKDWKKGQKTPAEIEAARLKRLEQSQEPQGKKLPVAKAEADMTEAELRAHIAAQVFK